MTQENISYVIDVDTVDEFGDTTQIPSKREIAEYYGQIYDNIKHMTVFVNSLVERYKNEL